MKNAITTINKLANQFSKLPGVGFKSAQRFAYKIVDMPKSQVDEFIAAIEDAKNNVKYCEICGNFTDSSPCDNCKNATDLKTICVVKEPKDVFTIEKIKDYKGSFHVLHGTISPLDNRGPDDIRIKELLNRISKNEVEEVVLALNPDVEGEATSMYITRLLKPLGVKVSKLAKGLSMGSDIDYADELTLSEAFNNRKYL